MVDYININIHPSKIIFTGEMYAIVILDVKIPYLCIL